MHTHNSTLYPLLGVGAFMTMFWTGVVVGHELGVGCASLLIMGLLCGCIATVGVVELQRRDGHGLAPAARGRVAEQSRPRNSTAGRGSRERGRPGPATIGGILAGVIRRGRSKESPATS